MEKLSFTLYEIFGYLLPGGIVFVAFVVLYWALFVPSFPLGIATFQVGLVTWVCVTLASYILGHAAQAVANEYFCVVEKTVLDSQPAWMRERALQSARDLLQVAAPEVESRWIVAALDEYTVQSGTAGDREIFVYREGFYRGMALSLFFLSLAIVVRMVFAGASIRFTKGLFLVSWPELFTTAAVIGGIGYLFLERYRRFAEYRITHAIVAALVLQGTPPPKAPSSDLQAGG
jgi:hypothetical protein